MILMIFLAVGLMKPFRLAHLVNALLQCAEESICRSNSTCHSLPHNVSMFQSALPPNKYISFAVSNVKYETLQLMYMQ